MPEREIVNVETSHEKSDVNVKALLWSVAVFIVFGFITHGILFVMFKYFAEIARGQTNEPMTEINVRAEIPPEPRLQPLQTKDRAGKLIVPNASTPVTDMEEMRAREDEAQKNAGWVDKSKGQVRLPIDVAKQLVVQRGLPVNSGGAQ